MRGLASVMVLAIAWGAPSACADGDGEAHVHDDDAGHHHEEDQAGGEPVAVRVHVTLDGAPAIGARVMQGGAGGAGVLTGEDGSATVTIDPTVAGERVLTASLPTARIEGVAWTPDLVEVTIALSSLGPDNPAYVFQDPGEPARRDNTAQCAHCHVTINQAWFDSPHRRSASNATVQDLYRGTASGIVDQAACAAAGGAWDPGSSVKGEERPPRCGLGAGVIPSLNDDPAHATQFAGCADCHAPGIDGVVGGRDLRDAAGHALDYGVHCDVCHRVESIDLAKPAGVAGRLVLRRPSERSSSIALGMWQPLVFGPDHDVPNPRMGLVQRDHFHEATLCAGCHQLDQPVLVPGASIDLERWPDGRLPIQTTYDEWQASPVGKAGQTCQSCHMPPDASAWNAADLQLFMDVGAGVAAGWLRPPGSVRKHAWYGPRQPASRMLQLAASVTIDKRLDDPAKVTARVTVTNVGAGHRVPTGEPMRAVLLLVEARCTIDGADVALTPTGGDTLPDWAGDALAGAPGAAFARVLRGADGTLMVPHFLAVDVASDNRLEPQVPVTSTHVFARPAGCEAPRVHARVLHRAYPDALARERGWTQVDQLMTEADR